MRISGRQDIRASSPHLWLMAILLLLLIGLGLRLWGSDWGLPYPLHPDEHKLVKHALAFGKGDLNPHYFTYPSLMMYLMFFMYGCYYAFSWLLGNFTSPDDLIIEFATNPQTFFLLIRWLSALLGTLTIGLTYLIGHKLYSRGVGLLAAAFLTFNYLHVMYSHYLMMDVPMTFMVMVAFWFAIGMAKESHLKHYVAAGICTGLAVSIKYPACFISIALLTAHLIAVRAQQGTVTLFSGRAWLAAALIPIGFVVGTPYSVLDGNTFWVDLLYTQSVTSRPLPMWDKVEMLFLKNLPMVLGIGIYVCTLAGVIRCLLRRGWAEFLLLSFPLVYTIGFLLLAGGLRPRDLTPLVPFCSLLVALFLVDTAGFLTRTLALRRPAAYALIVVAAMAVIFQPALQSVALAHFLAQPDTRIEAKAWIEHHLPAGARIGVEAYGPPLVRDSGPAQQREQSPGTLEKWWTSRGQITEKSVYDHVKTARQDQQWKTYDVMIDRAKQNAYRDHPRYVLFEITYLPYLWWLRLENGQVMAAELKDNPEYQAFFEPASFLADNQIEYVVLSSSTRSPIPMERLLKRQAKLLHRVEKHPMLGWTSSLPFSYLHHPTLEVYQLNP